MNNSQQNNSQNNLLNYSHRNNSQNNLNRVSSHKSNNSAKSTLAEFVRNITVLKDTVVIAAQQHADHTMSRDDGKQLSTVKIVISTTFCCHCTLLTFLYYAHAPFFY